MVRLITFLSCVLRVCGDWKWASLSLYPAHDKRCQPTALTINFQLTSQITIADVVTVNLAGYTSGTCANGEGGSIGITSTLFWPDESWTAEYVEGTVVNEFRDSYLKLTALEAFEKEYNHVIVLDPQNGITPNCGIDANDPLTTISGVIANDTAAATYISFNQTDEVNATYATSYINEAM